MSSHIKTTFRHALIYGSAGLIGKAVGFIMLPIYSHALQAEGYGVIGMIDTVLSVLTLLIGYGISGAMSRFYYDSDDQQRRVKVVSTAIILMFFLVVVVTLPALLFSEQVAWLAFGRSDWDGYIILAVFSFMATMTSKNAENYILIRQRSLFLSVVSLIRLIFGLLLNIYFIVYLQMGVEGYLYATLIDAILYSAVMHAIALKEVGIIYDKSIAKEVLLFSIPLLPGYIAMFIRGNADRVLLRTYLGLVQVGVFEVLFKFVTLIGFFAVEPFSKIWQVKRFEVCDLDDGPQIMSKVFTYHTAILLFLALIFSLEIPVILKLLTPEEFWLDGFIVYFAVFSRVLNAAYYHFLFGLLYAKETFKISINQTITAVISLLITIPLIWKFGLVGAVLATLLSWSFQCVVAYIMARPFYRIPFQWSAVIRMWALMTGLYWLAKDFTVTGTRFEGWLNLHLSPWLESFGTLLFLDRFKDGKLLHILINSMPTFADGIILFLYCFIFIIGLIFLKIIPLDMITRLFHIDTLRKPTRIFS